MHLFSCSLQFAICDLVGSLFFPPIVAGPGPDDFFGFFFDPIMALVVLAVKKTLLSPPL